MKLETLYTLDSKNKVRVFECEVFSNTNDVIIWNPSIVTKTGLLGGKLIEKIETVKEGKQKRTILEQAEFQAKALWNEKLDEGYKSFNILAEKANYQILKTNGDIKPHLETIFCNHPEASYTNRNWDELPMLAKKFKDVKNLVFPYIIQPKLNGVRCLVKFINDVDGHPGVKLCSRGGQYYRVPHLQVELAELYLNLKALGILRNIIIDGEIYKHGVPLEDISGAARDEKSVSGLFAKNNWLEYHMYDILVDDFKQSQSIRSNNLCLLNDHFNGTHLKIVSHYTVNNTEEVKKYHDQFISEGFEGAILRNPQGRYEFNQRSASLLKVKEYQDEEFKIIGCGYDSNKSLGESFYFILQNNINSLTFEARPTGTIAQKEEWYNNQNSWINKMATVRFFERSAEKQLPLQACVRHKDSKVLIEHLRPYGE